MKKRVKNQKGFTLIELIVVIAILGILAVVAVPKFGNLQKSAKEKADYSTAATIANAAYAYMAAEDKDTVDLNTLKDKYLQKDLAKPQSVDGDWSIVVDGDGNVTVKAGDTIMYPKQIESSTGSDTDTEH